MDAEKSMTDDRMFQRATEWVARLEAPGCTPEERDRFEDWLAEDAEHVRVWAHAETLHQRAAQLADDPWLRARTSSIPRSPPSRLWSYVAIAAGISLAVGLGWMIAVDGNPALHVYANESHVPQQRTLSDGSIATLDAGARLSTRFGWRARHLELERGRVQLQVAPSSKPLQMQVGNSSIRDIGTTFQVERLGDGIVEVSLLKGAVQVTSTGPQASQHMLDPGEQLQVLASGLIQPGPGLPRRATTAWLHGELVFDATPLQVVLERINRYGAAPLVISDPALARLAVSGSFHAGDTDALLSALEQGWSITARPRADGALELHRKY